MSIEVLASVFDVRDRVVLVTGGASGLGLGGSGPPRPEAVARWTAAVPLGRMW